MIYGATGMLQGPDDPAPAATSDPVYLSADYIERGIANGFLGAGVFNDVTVQPPVAEWPEHWRFLKET